MTQEAQLSVSLMFFPHFDILRGLLLYRRTVTWNLSVLYDKKQIFVDGEYSKRNLINLNNIISKSKCVCNSAYHMPFPGSTGVHPVRAITCCNNSLGKTRDFFSTHLSIRTNIAFLAHLSSKLKHRSNGLENADELMGHSENHKQNRNERG